MTRSATKAAARGTPPPDLSVGQRGLRPPTGDRPIDGLAFGDLINASLSHYRPGEQVRAVFAGANPANDLHRGGTFLVVEREHDGHWQRVADDGDWSTKFHWAKVGKAAARIIVTWDVADVPPGRYRLRYDGDAAAEQGHLTAFAGVTPPLAVLACKQNG